MAEVPTELSNDGKVIVLTHPSVSCFLAHAKHSLESREWHNSLILGVFQQYLNATPPPTIGSTSNSNPDPASTSDGFLLLTTGHSSTVLTLTKSPSYHAYTVSACFPPHKDSIISPHLVELARHVPASATSFNGDPRLVLPFIELLDRKDVKPVLRATLTAGICTSATLRPAAAAAAAAPSPAVATGVRVAQVQDGQHREALAKMYAGTHHAIRGIVLSQSVALEAVDVAIERGQAWAAFVDAVAEPVSAAFLGRPTSSEKGVSVTIVYTDEGYRRRGLAEEVVRAACEWELRAKEEGGGGREWVTIFWEKGRPAGRIYSKVGFVEELDWQNDDDKGWELVDVDLVPSEKVKWTGSGWTDAEIIE